MPEDMTSRERVLAALDHQQPDRLPMKDGIWGTTLARWRQEGMPADADPVDYFGFDFAGNSAKDCFMLPEEVLEEPDAYVVQRLTTGAVARRWKHQAGTPEYIDFAVKTRADWDRLKPRLRWDRSRIVNYDDQKRRNRESRRRGRFITIGTSLGFDKQQGYVGTENLLIMLATDPDWARDMFESSVDMNIANYEGMVAEGFTFDGAWVSDDLGYRNGTFFSPAMFRELLKPAHTCMNDFYHQHGLKTILHSCGGIREIVPDLVEAGWDCIQPLEVKAGMDLVELKQTFGDRVAFMGGLDVRTYTDPARAEAEIRAKIPVAKRGGGYLYHSDHSVPDNVSFAQYQHVMAMVRQYGAY